MLAKSESICFITQKISKTYFMQTCILAMFSVLSTILKCQQCTLEGEVLFILNIY